MGRRGGSLHSPGSRRGHRQGGNDSLHTCIARSAQDTEALVRPGSVPANWIGKDPEIQAAGGVDQGRDDGDLAT